MRTIGMVNPGLHYNWAYGIHNDDRVGVHTCNLFHKCILTNLQSARLDVETILQINSLRHAKLANHCDLRNCSPHRIHLLRCLQLRIRRLHPFPWLLWPQRLDQSRSNWMIWKCRRIWTG
jgi:hypothetical protein